MRRVPAALIAILVAVPLLSAALMTIAASTWVLDRGFYTSLLDDQRLYELPRVGSAAWTGDFVSGTGLDTPAALAALREVVTPAWMRSQALSAANQVFDFLQGRTGSFDIRFDLRPLKAALAGEPGRRFAETLARELPVGGSLADFTVAAHRLPTSRPSSLSVDRAAALLQAGLPSWTASVPDTARLSDSASFHGGDFRWGPGFGALNALVAADIVLVLLAAGALVAAAFVGGATRFERLQWLGWPLLVPSAGVFVIGLLVTLGLASGWMQWGIAHAGLEDLGFSAGFVDALVGAARHALSRVGTGFIATGAVAGGAAIGLLAWSWSLGAQEKGAST